MIKNKTAQLIFETVYCVLAVVGILSGLGYFSASFNRDFYVYYTNLSNYICAGVMFASLIATAKSVNRKEEGPCKTAPTFNFLCVILIMVTFLVYNILLAGENTVVEYFTSLSNMLLHAILPVMFILHWVLFYERRSLKWYYPLLCTVMPLVYVGFILIRAAILQGATHTVLYPYFFLDVSTLGWGGFFLWVGILLAVFILIGYALYAADHFDRSRLTRRRKESEK